MNILKILSALIILVWPLLVWGALQLGILPYVLPVLLIVFILRAILCKRQNAQMTRLALLSALVGVGLVIFSWLFKSLNLLFYYPVAVNALLFAVFFQSLLFGRPIVEQLARLTFPDLPPKAVAYTRTVTKVWCVFFVLNGSMALYTAVLADLDLWTLWNGLLSYLCIGALGAGEYLIRRTLMGKQPS